MKIVVETFTYFNKQTFVCLPDVDEVKRLYKPLKNQLAAAHFPYWAKLWPSCIALANFVHKNPQIVANKKILELAAGLSLPSLVAAQIAQEVVCSDYLPEPLIFVENSIIKNDLNNISCTIINWNNLPQNIKADVLLLSDINYDLHEFVNLNLMLQYFLQQGTTIVLATPQRLMAKQFIQILLPFCVQQQEEIIEQTAISLFVLKA